MFSVIATCANVGDESIAGSTREGNTGAERKSQPAYVENQLVPQRLAHEILDLGHAFVGNLLGHIRRLSMIILPCVTPARISDRTHQRGSARVAHVYANSRDDECALSLVAPTQA